MSDDEYLDIVFQLKSWKTDTAWPTRAMVRLPLPSLSSFTLGDPLIVVDVT